MSNWRHFEKKDIANVEVLCDVDDDILFNKHQIHDIPEKDNKYRCAWYISQDDCTMTNQLRKRSFQVMNTFLAILNFPVEVRWRLVLLFFLSIEYCN